MHSDFVLKTKRDEKEEGCKHKARLVVCANGKGNCQEETFPPVAHYFVIKLIFSLRMQREWTARHVDFENCFPSGRLEKPVYVETPAPLLPRLEHFGRVFWLSSSRYGLKDAARTWNRHLFKTFSECLLTKTNKVPCVFVDTTAVALYYVDYLILFAADRDSAHSSYHKLGKYFRVKDLGKSKRFLGLDLTSNDNDSVPLSQNQPINKLLQVAGMQPWKPVGSPIS